MEFNNIQLPAFAVVNLYKHSLVLVDGEQIGTGQLNVQPEKVVAITDTPIQEVSEKAPASSIERKEIKPENRNIEVKSINEIFNNIAPTTNQPIKIQQNPPTQLQPTKPVVAIKYLGGFGKKVSIVLEDHFHPHINDSDLAFLTKLLQACQLSLNDVAIINVVSNPTSNQLWQLMPAEKMIIFEVDPGTLGLPFRLSHFKLQPWSDCVFLAAPSLQALQEGTSEKVVQLKRNLWESLKKMFLA